MSEGTLPPNADETRVAIDLERVSTLDTTATRVAADLGGPPPDFDPAATQIGAQGLLTAPRPPGCHVALERFSIGDRIGGRYEVLAIHRGAMGVVYGTFDHELRLPRALKTVRDQFASNAELRKAFAAEAAIWIRLEKHPFIARAYEVQTFASLPYVVAEYIRGGEKRGPDLRSWIGDPSIGLPVAVEMALQIAQGMQHAVRKVPGLVHRDLKPANVLVNERAKAMVTDFGLAVGVGLEGGTPAYMAPEQWRGEAPDVQTDIYAYGCILFELFTLHRVYAARTDQEWRLSHLNDRPYPPRAHRTDLPEELETFVLRCLAKERGIRPASWDEIVGFFARSFHKLTGQPAVLDFDAYALDAGELFSAGHSLSELGAHHEEELELYARALAAAAGDDPITAALLVNKGVALGELGRNEEQIRAFDEVVTRFGEAPDAYVRKQVAVALRYKGLCFDSLGRGGDAVRVFDELVARFANAPEGGVRDQVAQALYMKGVVLGQLGLIEDEISAYDDVAGRFAGAPEETIRECVASALITKATTLGRLGRRESEVLVYDEIVDRLTDASEDCLRDLLATALLNKGVTLGELGRGEDAARVYDDVASRFSRVPEAAMREQVATHLYNRGVTLGKGDRREDAVRVFDVLAARFSDDSEARIRCLVATALNNKGVALGELGQSEEEMRVYDEVAERFSDDPEADVRKWAVQALFNKAIRLGERGMPENDVWVTNELAARFGQDPSAGVREVVATALLRRGQTLGARYQCEEAVQAYDEVVELFGDAPEAGIRELVGQALFGKAFRLGWDARYEEQVKIYDQIVSRYADAPEWQCRRWAAASLVNKAGTLAELERGDEELDTYDEVVTRFAGDADGEVRSHVAMALHNKGIALCRLGRPEEALRVFDEIVARLDQVTEPGSPYRVADALVRKGNVLVELKRSRDATSAYEEVIARFAGATERLVCELVLKARHGREQIRSLAKDSPDLAASQRARAEDVVDGGQGRSLRPPSTCARGVRSAPSPLREWLARASKLWRDAIRNLQRR